MRTNETRRFSCAQNRRARAGPRWRSAARVTPWGLPRRQTVANAVRLDPNGAQVPELCAALGVGLRRRCRKTPPAGRPRLELVGAPRRGQRAGRAPKPRLWWSCPHTNHLVVLRAQWSAAPPLIAQKAAAAEPSIRHRRWRLRAPSAHLGAAGAGRRQQALDAPNQPSRCFTGPVYRAASAPVRAHGCGEAAAHQPPRRCSSAVRGGSCRSARAAARPAAGLSRDSRFGG